MNKNRVFLIPAVEVLIIMDAFQNLFIVTKLVSL